MEKYFPELNEKYRKKNYPDGVFARMHKNTEKCPGCNVDHEQK